MEGKEKFYEFGKQAVAHFLVAGCPNSDSKGSWFDWYDKWFKEQTLPPDEKGWHKEWDRIINETIGRGSGCRDCADSNGFCPTDKLPCDPTERVIHAYKNLIGFSEWTSENKMEFVGDGKWKVNVYFSGLGYSDTITKTTPELYKEYLKTIK